MKPTLFNEPRAMTAVPVKTLVYLLASANVEAVTADRTLFFQKARLWPYKAMNATTGAPTANLLAIRAGQSGLPVSIAALTSLIVAAGEALATSAAHGFFSGQFVTIAGATPGGLNGSTVIYEATANTFKFRTSVADGPATGTITAVKGAALPWSIAAATTTPLEIILPLGQKRALADLVISGTATDGVYVEWE